MLWLRQQNVVLVKHNGVVSSDIECKRDWIRVVIVCRVTFDRWCRLEEQIGRGYRGRRLLDDHRRGDFVSNRGQLYSVCIRLSDA